MVAPFNNKKFNEGRLRSIPLNSHPSRGINVVEEKHARQALKDIWQVAKARKESITNQDEKQWLGELMAKVSTVLEFDFGEPNA